VIAGKVTLDALTAAVGSGAIETVEIVIVDLQGRLQGKRVTARYFLEEVVSNGAEAQTYLLATDVEMGTVDGFELASWSTGYGNMLLRVDLDCVRHTPWHPKAVVAICDVEHLSGAPVSVSPRQMLRKQVERLTARGWSALTGVELEFQLFDTTYADAWTTGYRSLRPATQYGSDYGMLDTRGIGPFMDRLTSELSGSGIPIDSILSEAAPGQYEIVLSPVDVLTTCDNQALGKYGAKQIAAAAEKSLTFMAKLDAHEGNSCHVHFSLRDDTGQPVFAGDGEHGFSPVMRSFLAGQLRYLPELTLMFAPNINSYKRFVDDSYAPTVVAWGLDNRSCALRVVGSGPSLRFEHRAPGGDANLHVALAAVIAAGLRGLDEGLELPAPIDGNAYGSPLPRMPRSLAHARQLFTESRLAAEAFGLDVVCHLGRMAERELEVFGSSVTDWERFRGFERM
jgi:glutamine synthetase